VAEIAWNGVVLGGFFVKKTLVLVSLVPHLRRLLLHKLRSVRY
jgi:hypothetical protein